MRRITLWVMTTLSALVLLVSYRTSTMGVDGAATASAAPAGTTTSSTTPSSTTPSSTTPSETATAEAAQTPQTFTGDSVDTRWGPVQVQVSVQDGKVTDVQAVVYPDENHRDVEINSYALPQLRQEVLAAQSAQVDAVSGATVTSDGYLSSLQSALDQAHLS